MSESQPNNTSTSSLLPGSDPSLLPGSTTSLRSSVSPSRSTDEHILPDRAPTSSGSSPTSPEFSGHNTSKPTIAYTGKCVDGGGHEGIPSRPKGLTSLDVILSVNKTGEEKDGYTRVRRNRIQHTAEDGTVTYWNIKDNEIRKGRKPPARRLKEPEPTQRLKEPEPAQCIDDDTKAMLLMKSLMNQQ